PAAFPTPSGAGAKREAPAAARSRAPAQRPRRRRRASRRPRGTSPRRHRATTLRAATPWTDFVRAQGEVSFATARSASPPHDHAREPVRWRALFPTSKEKEEMTKLRLLLCLCGLAAFATLTAA